MHGFVINAHIVIDFYRQAFGHEWNCTHGLHLFLVDLMFLARIQMVIHTEKKRNCHKKEKPINTELEAEKPLASLGMAGFLMQVVCVRNVYSWYSC